MQTDTKKRTKTKVALKVSDDVAVPAAPAMLPAQGKRGHIANYLTSLSIDQIIDNTLTGFLVDLIRKKGKQMSVDEMLSFTLNRYSTLRKPSGKAYNP